MKEPSDPSSQLLPTADVVRAAQAGDPAAWADIHARYSDLMHFIVHGRIPEHLRGRFDTDDVVQSGFVQAIEQIGAYRERGDASFRAWLRRLMLNKLTSKVRFHSAERRDGDREATPRVEDLAEPADLTSSPTRAIAFAETIARAVVALSKLSSKDQEVMRLRVVERMSWAEIAERLSIGETTARRRFLESFERLVDHFD